MVTIAHLTEQLIKKRPFIQEALQRGIINYGALAEEMLPEIRSELGKEVRHAAVMMAVRRYQEKITQSNISRIRIGRKAEVHVRPNLMEIAMPNSKQNRERIRRMMIDKQDKFSFSISTTEISIITSRRHETMITDIFGKQRVISDLAALVIYFDRSFMFIPGFYYLILRELAWEHINVYELVSTTTELNIVIHETEVGRGFHIINRLFSA